MKALKSIVIDELIQRINNSPFLIVVEYAGMKVKEFEAIRSKLLEQEASFYVTKNTFVKRAADAAGLPEELAESLVGQNAVVTGNSDICGAAKAIKDFTKETKKGIVKAGILDGRLLTPEDVDALASLPPLPVLQAQFLGLLNAPASKLVRTLNEPAAALARVLQAKVDAEKGE